MISAIQQTKSWIDKMVLGQALCPFAAKLIREEQLAIKLINGSRASIMHRLVGEALFLSEKNCPYSSAILVMEEGFEKFSAYLDLLYEAEALMEEAGISAQIQIASFHPEYVFEGASTDDPANYSNRSPLPLFHLLKVEDVHLAIKDYGDTNEIPEKNKISLRALGMSQIEAIYNEIKGEN